VTALEHPKRARDAGDDLAVTVDQRRTARNVFLHGGIHRMLERSDVRRHPGDDLEPASGRVGE